MVHVSIIVFIVMREDEKNIADCWLLVEKTKKFLFYKGVAAVAGGEG